LVRGGDVGVEGCAGDVDAIAGGDGAGDARSEAQVPPASVRVMLSSAGGVDEQAGSTGGDGSGDPPYRCVVDEIDDVADGVLSDGVTTKPSTFHRRHHRQRRRSHQQRSGRGDHRFHRPGGTGLLINATGADKHHPHRRGRNLAPPTWASPRHPAGNGVKHHGASLNPNITPLTNLSDLRGGLGIDPTGLIITNRQKTATINLSTATTVEDLLNLINNSGTGVLARLGDDGTSIDILNPVQGSKMTIAENGGTTAADLGIRSFRPSSLLSELNGGKGVTTVAGADIQITRRDGTNFSVDLSSLNTVQDVINAITPPTPAAASPPISPPPATAFILTDSTVGGSLTVSALNASPAADNLGIKGTSPTGIITGADVNPIETTGIFGNLGKLRSSLLSSDQTGITAAAKPSRKTSTASPDLHGQVGAQVKEFEARQNRLADQNVATKAMLSQLEDTDFNEAITRFQTLQTALQANLQTTGRLLNLNLLDFLQ